MASDINTYALSVEFGLLDRATPQLDLIDQRLGKVEEQIGTIATKAMGSMQVATTQLNTTLTQIAQQYDKINQANLSGLKPMKDSTTIGTESEKRLVKEAAMLKDDVLKTWIDITKILEVKARQLTEESNLIEKEKGQVEQVAKGLKTWSSSVEDATAALVSHVKGLFNVRDAIREAIRAAEDFKNANYRVYGSQTELVGRANTLALQYGIMSDKAREAIAMLGNLKVPNDMLDKLTETTVKFNRMSDVTIYQTSVWQKGLVAMGATIPEIERRMVHMAAAMRRFGLDTQDVTSIMATQSAQGQYLRNTFGDKTAMEIQRAQVAIAAFSKELGATPEVVQAAAASLGTIEPWRLEQLGAMTGVAAAEMRTAEGQTRAFAVATASLADKLRVTTDANQRNALMMQAQAQYGQQLGTSIFNLAQQQSASTSTIKTGAEAYALMDRALNGHIDSVDTLSSVYTESNQTITAQLRLLQNSFIAAIGVAWSKIEPAIILFLQWLNSLIYVIQQVIVTVGGWLDSLGPVGTTIKYIAAAVMVAITVFVVLNAVLSAFGMAASLAGSAGSAMGIMVQKSLEGLGKGLQALAGHQTTMLVLSLLFVSMGVGAFLFALGVAKIAEHGTAGIKALLGLTVAIVLMAVGLALAGQIAQSAALGLALIAVVLLAAGVSAIMLAVAVQMLAAVGQGAIGSLILLSLVLIGLGIGLVLLGALAMPVIPAIYAIAVALLIVSLAAVLFAVAMSLAVDSLGKLNVGLALNILGFAAVMILAGSVLIVAASILLAAVMILVPAAILLAVSGALIYAGSLLLFIGGVLLVLGAGLIAVASVLMVIAAPFLLVGSLLLATAGPVLMLAGALIIPGAVALLAGGSILLVAAAVIAVAGLLILIGGAGVWAGGAMLNAGAPLLQKSAIPLIIGSIALMYAAPFLLVASAILAVAGVLLLVAGTGVLLGGLFMVTGAAMLLGGAVMMGMAAAAIITGAPLMIAGSMMLIAVGAVLMVASTILLVPAAMLAVIGLLLLIGGLGILLGGMMVKAGAWFLLGGGQMLMDGAPKLTVASGLLVPAALALLVAGLLLLVASVPFLTGATSLLVGGAIFFVASLILAAGAIFFEVAAEVLSKNSLDFLVASLALVAAGAMLVLASSLIIAGSGMMVPAAAGILIAGAALWLASGPIIRAASALEATGSKWLAIGIGFFVGGYGLLIGGQMMLASVGVLRSAGKALGGMAGQLKTDLEPMLGVADYASKISGPLVALGQAIYWGSMKLFFGAMWLRAATNELADPISDLCDQIGQLSECAVDVYAAAVYMYNASVLISYSTRLAGGLLYIAGSIAASSSLIGPAVSMAYALFVLSASVVRFSESMTGIGAAMVEPLGEVMTTFASESQLAALELFDAFDLILSRMETYGDRMVSSATRISGAFRSILPTLAIGALGVTMPSQPITTTRMRDSSDMFSERNAKLEEMRQRQQIVNKLADVASGVLQLNAAVKSIGGGEGSPILTAVTEIHKILKIHLPKMSKSKTSGLTHALSEWMG